LNASAETTSILLVDDYPRFVARGGLLVACSADSEAQVLGEFGRHGFDAARRFGTMVAGQGVSVA